MINMITKVYNLYPNGIEKFGKTIGNNSTICPKVRVEALDMIDRGVSLNLTARKLKLDATTISGWIKPVERY